MIQLSNLFDQYQHRCRKHHFRTFYLIDISPYFAVTCLRCDFTRCQNWAAANTAAKIAAKILRRGT